MSQSFWILLACGFGLIVLIGILSNIKYRIFPSKFKKRRTVHFNFYEELNSRDALLILAADVINADGHFKKSELDYLTQYFKLNMGDEKARDAILKLQEIMQETYSLASACSTLKFATNLQNRLQIVQFLFGLASADGAYTPEEILEIDKIALLLGIPSSIYNPIKAMNMGTSTGYGGHQTYGGGYRSEGSSGYRSHTIDNDYKVLGIDSDASDDEVKKAYREMAKQYHPDKWAHKGEAERKEAEEKFARINDAYGRIKKSRGMG